MLGIHSYWGAPQWAKLNAAPDDPLKIPYFLLLTWITSAVSWRRNMGSIKLFTDEDGLRVMKAFNLHWMYDDIDISLTKVRFPISKRAFSNIFWAANKIYALRACKDVPCCQIDTDAIIWQPFEQNGADLIYLHNEDRTHSCYARNQRKFDSLMPPEFGKSWVWDAQIQNTGLMAFYDLELKNYFARQSIGFMERYITNFSKEKDVGQMCFAEQQILPMCCAILGKKSAPIGQLYDGHLKKNPIITHLWNSKHLYEQNFLAMEFYCLSLIQYLRANAPMSNPVCNQIESGLKEMKTKLKPVIIAQQRRLKKELPTIKNIQGKVVAHEPNLPCTKTMQDGDIIFPWEQLQCSEGSFEIYNPKTKVRQKFFKK